MKNLIGKEVTTILGTGVVREIEEIENGENRIGVLMDKEVGYTDNVLYFWKREVEVKE